MQKHTQIYFEHFGYGEQDRIRCENCGSEAVDVHHAELKGMGGSKTKDTIDNLIALCRACHENAHAGKIKVEHLKRIHAWTLTNKSQRRRSSRK